MIQCINTCLSIDRSLRACKNFRYDNYELEMINGEGYYRIWYGKVVTALYKKSNFTIMPNHLKDYTTEFNYLFHEIYKLYREVKGNRIKIIELTQ